jgi:putative flippase GtrA
MTGLMLDRLVRVVIAGGGATAIDTIVLAALYYGVDVAPGSAAVLGCLAGGAVNFVLNRRWVFGATDGAWLRQAALYAGIIVGGGAVISGLTVAALHVASLPLLLAKVGAIGIVLVAWTYPMSARVVFRARAARAA